MNDEIIRYTLRTQKRLMDKLGYIAEFEGRTKNKEIERLVKNRVAEFEREHGEIEEE